MSTSIEAWFQLRRLEQQIQTVLARELQAMGGCPLMVNEYYLLYFLNLAKHGKLKQIDLEDKLGLSLSATSRMIAKLEEKNCGVIARQVCPEDKRAVYIVLTPKGRDLVESVNPLIDKALQQFPLLQSDDLQQPAV